jgi:hypothetical protein
LIENLCCLVSHLSIPRLSIANRLAERTAEYKRRHGSFSKAPRRVSTQIDSEHYIEEEVQLRVDSLDNRNIKL